jgi:DNA-binding GntR family transcriptional regulator
MASTFHTYPELIADAGRPARTDWGDRREHTAAEAVAATLRLDPQAVIVRATDATGCRLIGLMPGGLA